MQRGVRRKISRRGKVGLACGLAVLLLAALALGGYLTLRRMFPLHYSEEIYAVSTEQGLDPMLVAAIVRNESSFRPTVKSGAGACGLMQLMPSTAEWIAQKNGMDYDEDMLLEPESNLRLGCVYYKYLQGRFGQTEAALAAWNGGEGNVRKWIEEGLDVTKAEQIPFEETKNFVKKVMLSHEIYRFLYGN